MSNSNFKLIEEPINRNLVIFVNKNGDVGTDTLALQDLLTSRETPDTGITIIRETSPTPSVNDEIEEDMIQQSDFLRNQYMAEHPNASDEEIEQHVKKLSADKSVPHVTLNVENFYGPEQAKKFKADILNLGRIDNPQMLMPIDQNFRRQIVQNDHCYTPLTLASKEEQQKPGKSSKTNKDSPQQPSKANSNKKEPKAKTRQIVKDEIESSESGEEEEYEDEEQSAEEEEISFSESDDDNDMDFSVNDRFGKKGKKKRKYRRHKQKNMTFKDFLEGGGDMSSMDEEPKKKYGKVVKKSQQAQRVSGKNIGPATSRNPQQQNQSSVTKKLPAQASNKNAMLRKEISTNVKPSLPASPAQNAPNPSSVISQISIQSAAPAKSTQEIEFVEKIVKDLEKSFSETDEKKSTPPQPNSAAVSASSIPNIMQMMETNTPTEVIDHSLSTLENIDAANVGIDEIGDAIIAVLGNEAIDELLNHGDLMNFETAHAQNDVKSTNNVVSSSSSAHHEHLMPDVGQLMPDTSSSAPKILNRQAPQKDPIKVVRNGRVITLPPIEAPTTRGAKRRAQGDPISTSPVSNKVVKAESKTPSVKDPDSKNSSRRSSLNKSDSGRNSRRQSMAAQGTVDEENEDGNSDASWNSEDDPDRLWCICKQPHNNRFMICCDKCEDWFHGTCVNVTKAMGKDIEKQNIKWLCPNCKTNAGAVKKDPNKKPLNQQKLTKFFSRHAKESTDEDVPKTNTAIMCAVCHKKPARTDSIYCSEDCIRSHATKHLDDSAMPKTPNTIAPSSKIADGKRGNVLKDQSGNVSVFDRTTGKLLSAKLWPHISNLGQWLSQNPNYEPVKPGSSQANQLLSRSSKNAQVLQNTAASNSTVTSSSSPHHTTKHHTLPVIAGDELFSNPVKINTGVKDQPALVQKKLTSILSPTIKTSPTTTRPPLLKSTSVSSSTSNKSVTSVKVQEVKKVKRQASDEKPQATSSQSNNKSKIEIERNNVKKILKDTLITRMKNIDDTLIPKMNDEEIEKFAKAIEHEMFLFFNKDTRDKYKVKFRSLKFNLSDTKNKTLIERICMKKLTPKQLVELPSSELASSELSKWREEENKHQLEIITKSELDALAQNKIVLKTHKGEEIIETKAADISLPDDDVESVIEKTVLNVDDPHGKYDLSRSISLNVSGNQSVISPLSSPSISSSTGRKSDSHHHSRSRSKSRGRDHHHHKSSSKHKKGEHRHRSRSPKHHHHSQSHRDKSDDSHRDKSRGRHSRDKSRDRSRDRDHGKRQTEEHKHHRDKSRSNEKDKSTSRSKDSSKDNGKKHHHAHHHSSKESTTTKESVIKKDEKIEIKPEQEDVDIVGKILDSMGVHLDTKPKTEEVASTEEVKIPDVSSSLIDVPATGPISVDPVNEHQLEIEIYSGNMYMADVANLDVTASVVSGNVDDIIKMFNPQMEIVGRIEPKTVWDYLGKVKKLPGKELSVLRFSSTNEAAYFSLFSYLHSRQRYGVIKSPAPNIKDFYLITVEANRPLPPVLLPISGPGFIEGEEHKPDLLLGVILKIIPESKHLHKKSSASKKVNKTSKPVEVHNVPIQIIPAKHKPHHSHGHSHSQGNSKLTVGLPEVKSDKLKHSPKQSTSKDDDEPYTPFDEDSLTPPRSYGNHSARPSTGSTAKGSNNKMNTSDDLESEMEKLTREIERRQIEIQTLAQQKALELDEAQASKIFEKISVPHNLSEILSTIKASEPKPMEIDDDDEEEYVPMASKSATHDYRPTSSYSAVTQPKVPIANSMMDIDERINLFRQEMPSEQPSRLASMSDADLLALVPEDAIMAPPPPVISNSISEPTIPGLGYEGEK